MHRLTVLTFLALTGVCDVMPVTGEDPRPLRLAIMAIVGMFLHGMVTMCLQGGVPGSCSCSY